MGRSFSTCVDAMRDIVEKDENVIVVGFAMDVLSRLALMGNDDASLPEDVGMLRKDLKGYLEKSPLFSWESLCRTGLDYYSREL